LHLVFNFETWASKIKLKASGVIAPFSFEEPNISNKTPPHLHTRQYAMAKFQKSVPKTC